MKYDSQKHHRRSIRLKGYDYTQAGAYFVTICAYQRTHVFGEVVNGCGAVLWQKNYYEHIVRNDRELRNIGWYIVNNPLNWQLDRDNLRNNRKLSPPANVKEYVKDVEEMVLKSKADSQ